MNYKKKINNNFLSSTGFINDKEEQWSKDLQSKNYSNYVTSRPINSNNGRNCYLSSLNHLGMYTNNKSSYGNYIDTESKLKSSKITNEKEKNKKLLNSRPFPTIPFMGAGETHIVNPDLYSKLVSGTDTRVKKAGDSLAGVSIDRFIPLVPCLADNVQNPVHIIPEYWVRGGESSRADLQNCDYFSMCGFEDN